MKNLTIGKNHDCENLVIFKNDIPQLKQGEILKW